MIAIITVNLHLLCLTPEISNDRGGPSQEVKRIHQELRRSRTRVPTEYRSGRY